MEAAGWERAHGYASNEHLLEKFGDRVPVRKTSGTTAISARFQQLNT